jgi:hypothetical protein
MTQLRGVDTSNNLILECSHPKYVYFRCLESNPVARNCNREDSVKRWLAYCGTDKLFRVCCTKTGPTGLRDRNVTCIYPYLYCIYTIRALDVLVWGFPQSCVCACVYVCVCVCVCMYACTPEPAKP